MRTDFKVMGIIAGVAHLALAVVLGYKYFEAHPEKIDAALNPESVGVYSITLNTKTMSDVTKVDGSGGELAAIKSCSIKTSRDHEPIYFDFLNTSNSYWLIDYTNECFIAPNTINETKITLRKDFTFKSLKSVSILTDNAELRFKFGNYNTSSNAFDYTGRLKPSSTVQENGKTRLTYNIKETSYEAFTFWQKVEKQKIYEVKISYTCA